MAEILITGAAGFIGSHLAERLLSEGHRVTGIDNFDPYYTREIKERNLAALVDQEAFNLIEGDIRNTAVFERVSADIDVVIHLAAKAGVRPSIEDPDEYLQVNVAGTQNLVNWMGLRHIKKLLFAGSSSVYGNNKKIPFSEDDVVDFPISPYAYTKKACELLLHTYYHLHGISTLCLRFFTVYGPRQRPDLAIHKFTRLIFDGQPIPMFGDGSTSRDYTFVDDTVDGIVRAMDYLSQRPEPVFDIINLGNNQPVKLSALIDTLFKVSGKTVPVNRLDMQPGDVDVTYADITKARTLLGYDPGTGIEEGLRKFVQWYERNRES